MFKLDVAAEELKSSFPDEAKIRALSSFEYEISLSTFLYHPNLVRCLGAAYNGHDGHAYWAVFHLCHGGTLKSLLQQRPRNEDGSGSEVGIQPYVRSEKGLYSRRYDSNDPSVSKELTEEEKEKYAKQP